MITLTPVIVEPPGTVGVDVAVHKSQIGLGTSVLV
jgi:hypothetical protein